MGKAPRYLSWTVIALLLIFPALALAQSGSGYDLFWFTIDGGGYTFSTGGAYSLGSTAAQPDAGVLSGGNYALAGGFWGSSQFASDGDGGGGGGETGGTVLYLPLIMRQFP